MNAAEIDLKREENRRKALEKYGPPFSVLAHRLLDAWLSWREDTERDPDAPSYVLDPDPTLRLTIDAELRLACLDDGNWYDANPEGLDTLARDLGGARPPPIRYDATVDHQELERLRALEEKTKAYYATRDEMDAIDEARRGLACTSDGEPCWKIDPKKSSAWCDGCVDRQRLTSRLKKLQKSCAGLTKQMRLLVSR